MEISFENSTVRVHRLWTSDDTYTNHRIPGMICTRHGIILLYHEARRAGHDWATMDILLERSADGGQHFSSPVILAQGSAAHPTVNNPVMVQDAQGRVHFLYCEDYAIRGGRVLHRYSDDDGLTWSHPRDLTTATRPDIHHVFAPGPGHGICTREGMLIVPVWLVPTSAGAPEDAHAPSRVSTLYSRDRGETWALGDILPDSEAVTSPSEAQVAEIDTTDGGHGIYMNIRTPNGCRASAWSHDGISDWTVPARQTDLVDSSCFASLLRLDCPGASPVLVLAHCDHPEDRLNITLRISRDGGHTWRNTPTDRLLIDANHGGYPALGTDGNRLYLAYEENYGQAAYWVVVEEKRKGMCRGNRT